MVFRLFCCAVGASAAADPAGKHVSKQPEQQSLPTAWAWISQQPQLSSIAGILTLLGADQQLSGNFTGTLLLPTNEVSSHTKRLFCTAADGLVSQLAYSWLGWGMYGVQTPALGCSAVYATTSLSGPTIAAVTPAKQMHSSQCASRTWLTAHGCRTWLTTTDHINVSNMRMSSSCAPLPCQAVEAYVSQLQAPLDISNTDALQGFWKRFFAMLIDYHTLLAR
jgi:hypothetical protein